MGTLLMPMFPTYEDKQGWNQLLGTDRAPNPLTTNYDVDLWNRRNQLRQEMGPVEPIPGGHMISAAQKLFRAMAPDWDWTLRKLASGEFQDKPWSDVWASANAWDPERPEDRLLAGMPMGGAMGATKVVKRGPGMFRVNVLRGKVGSKPVGRLDFSHIPGTGPQIQGISSDIPRQGIAREAWNEFRRVIPEEDLAQTQWTPVTHEGLPFWQNVVERGELPGEAGQRMAEHLAMKSDALARRTAQDAAREGATNKMLWGAGIPAAGYGAYKLYDWLTQ